MTTTVANAEARGTTIKAENYHLVHSRLHNLFFDNASIIGVFHHRDNEVSKLEKRKETSALKIQKAFRAQRFRMAEQAYRDGVKAGAQWIQRVLGLPAYASRIVSDFTILGSLPKGLPVLLHRWHNHFILSFPEDLALPRRREYAKACSLSSQPVLKLSGIASLKAFDACAQHASDEPSPRRRRRSRGLLYA